MGIFVQNCFDTNLNYKVPTSKKSEIDITRVHLFFQISYLLVSKIEICPSYVLDKTFPLYTKANH